MIDLLVGEWLKLRTTRLLYGMVIATLALTMAAVAGAVLSDGGAVADLESTAGIRRIFSVTGSGALVMLVLGIIISAGEYRHGTAADTFLTTARRHRVVVAKVAFGAGLGLGVGLLVSTCALALAVGLYRVEGASFPFDEPEVWLTLAGTVVYTTLFAVLGVALGAVVRNQVLAVAGALGWFAVVEHTLVNLVPDVGRWLPAAAGQAIVRTHLPGLLSPIGGVTVLVVYAATAAIAGIGITARRDA